MTQMTKKELAKITRSRYRLANKKLKAFMLNEFCANTGYNRKYAIRLFNAKPKEVKKKRGRKRTYDSKLFLIIIEIWELLDFPCGTRLAPNLLITANAMERCGEIEISDIQKEKLEYISAKTLDRRLKKERVKRKLDRSRGMTKSGNLLKSSIPIKITDWDRNKLGFMETDTVSHNGGDPSGEFIFSIDLTEIYSGWTEQIAVMGKGQTGVVKGIDNIKSELPFKLLGIDSDSGGEFINWHLVKYCEKNYLGFTRSRPYMKNDNAYVEQKNYTHIRKLLGYDRFDSFELLELINDLYRNEWRLFTNFFRPVMKIESKEKINNSVCRKKFDVAKTPYHRLIESGQITKEQKSKLDKLYLSLNPVQLKKQINEKVKKIKQIARAAKLHN